MWKPNSGCEAVSRLARSNQELFQAETDALRVFWSSISTNDAFYVLEMKEKDPNTSQETTIFLRR